MRFRYPHVVSTLALVLALTGTAAAAGLIDGAKIKPGTITSRQIRDGALSAADISAAAARTLRGRPGPAGPAGPSGASGQPGSQGPAGPPGTPGSARAYGLVTAAGSLVAARSKGIAAVTSPGTGTYCLRLDAAIDASKVIAQADPEFSLTSDPAPTADWASANAGCAAVPNSIEIETGILATPNPNDPDTQVSAASVAEPFTVAIP